MDYHRNGVIGMLTNRLMSGLCAAALVMGMAAPPAAAEGPRQEAAVRTEFPSGTYRSYLETYRDAPRPDRTVLIDVPEAAGGRLVSTALDGETRQGLLTTDEETVEWTVRVEEAGLYSLYMEYCTQESKGASIERGVLIDGELPFSEASSLSFSRVWRDAPSAGVEEAGRRFDRDSRGNELVPEQEEVPSWIGAWFTDAAGYADAPLLFYFEAGEHTLALESIREPMIIGSLALCQYEEAPSYGDYLAMHGDKAVAGAYSRQLQGEDAVRKSDAVLVPGSDRTSAATEPSDPSRTRLNTIGGANWSTNGQWLEWEVQVPESGLYKIAVKYRQNFLSGMTANRRLTIDGQLPFREAGELSFPYGRGWKTVFAGKDGEDFYFYLEGGKTHTLRLECTLGASGELLERAQEIVTRLNGAYRQLVMYVGGDPDVNRDYKIEQALPDAIEALEDGLAALKSLSADLVAFSGERGDANVVLDNLTGLLDKMLEDTRDIPRLMSSFRDNAGGLATWIQTQSRQSLEIDYLTVQGDEEPLPKANAGFWESLVFGVRTFIASFTQDYSLLTGAAGADSIDVWVTTGRDQAQVIKTLIENDFTPKTGIGVNLKLVSGQLLMATVAGTGPDVSLMNSSADIMNFSLRSAVESLNGYPGFDELRPLYHESAWLPLTFGEEVFALPETQSFPVMFYRSDVLAELGLTPPETWTELYTVIGELQKNNLQFGMPLGMSGYGMLLYQNGGYFYNEDGTGTGLLRTEAVETFKQWTRLFTNYGVPLAYDPANRLRSGEMPLLIADYTLYNTLSVSAPEIKGLWGFAPVPGIQKEDGVDRSVASGVTGCILMKQSDKKPAAWEFLRWWTGTDTQAAYGKKLECVLGSAARYPAANIQVLEQLPWKSADYRVIEEQWRHARGIPEIPGSYYTSRHIENAFRRVTNYGEDERDTIEEYARTIDEEIQYKRHELGLD